MTIPNENSSLRASSPFGDIVKSTRARGTREETRLRGGGEEKGSVLARSLSRSRAARFARPNRRACSQAISALSCGTEIWISERLSGLPHGTIYKSVPVNDI